jgi:aminopeptidase YwaD
MNRCDYIGKASSYLIALCGVKPNRRTGSKGNQAASDFFAKVVNQFGYKVDTTPFDCLDYVSGKPSLVWENHSYLVFISPYSMGCDIAAELTTVSTLEELETCQCQGRILLMKGAICAEQLMPKEFGFYNPDHHKRIYSLLEEKNPAAIITATERKPELVGALDPFPLIVDGDFDIPNAYCTSAVGDRIARQSGEVFHLKIEAERRPSKANNVIARKKADAPAKIVVSAHIDAYENSPGASDNGSGTVVLLLFAEMLSEYNGKHGVEIVAFNGEDHYSAGGQMDYLNRYGKELDRIRVAINVDDVGYRVGGSAYSFYECPPEIRRRAETAFLDFEGIKEREPWFAGDHMIFVQNGLASIAITAEMISELMATVTHTSLDTPDIVDAAKLVDIASALASLIRQFGG